MDRRLSQPKAKEAVKVNRNDKEQVYKVSQPTLQLAH